MICYAKLNLSFDLSPLKNEVAGLLANQQWMPHFNPGVYNGNWHMLTLRAPGGRTDNPFADLMTEAAFADTPLLALLPETAKTINSFECEKLSVRLLNLKAGAVIKEHKDRDLAFEKGEARLHIPLFTNDLVQFFVEKDCIVMREGECWYINANLPHRVSNLGDTDRVHLVIDCKVNEWLQSVFEQAEKVTATEIKDKVHQLEIIKNLRLHQTPHSAALADQLEQELNRTKSI